MNPGKCPYIETCSKVPTNKPFCDSNLYYSCAVYQKNGNSYDMQYIPTNTIKVGNRRRQDYGDMDALMESIKTNGLLHPVTVNSDHGDGLYLVAGGRRLEACKRLGMPQIPVKYLRNLSETELRALELEENIRRKDLTEAEKSRNLAALVEAMAETLSDECEFRSETDQNATKVGRPAKPNSLSRVADRIGVPKPTIIVAQQHAKALDEFPALENLPKYKAVEYAKKLRVLPEPKRSEVLEEIICGETASVTSTTNEAPPTKRCTKCGVEKELADFYSGKNVCRECFNAAAHSRRMTDVKGNPYTVSKELNDYANGVKDEILASMDEDREIIFTAEDLLDDLESVTGSYTRNLRRCTGEYKVDITKDVAKKIIAVLSQAEAAINALKGAFNL